jgi:hypothetical protein
MDKCKVCEGSGSVPTGHHVPTGEGYDFVPDGETKQCYGCEGTGIPKRLWLDRPSPDGVLSGA